MQKKISQTIHAVCYYSTLVLAVLLAAFAVSPCRADDSQTNGDLNPIAEYFVN